jgi:hypothetical protein
MKIKNRINIFKKIKHLIRFNKLSKVQSSKILIFLIVSFVSALTMLIGCTTRVDYPFSTGRVEGIVTNSLSVPIPDVTISASGKDEKTVTDLNGRYSLDFIPTGEVAIIASKYSYQSAMSVVNVPVGQVKSSVNFVLRKE